MPVLDNARYERMAQELFKGAKIIDAHERAGFARNSGNAARINALECVQQRVAELHSLGAAKLVEEVAVIDATYVKQQAHRMFEACSSAALIENEDGTITLDAKAANVAARYLDQLGNHKDVGAFAKQQDVSLRISIDAALSKLGALSDIELIEADYTTVD